MCEENVCRRTGKDRKGGDSMVATRGHRVSFHVKVSLNFAFMNPTCKETGSCLFSPGTEKIHVIVSGFCKEMFGLIFRFSHSCGLEFFS